MQKLIFLDTETTGNTPTDVLCQLAFKTENETFCELYKPAIPIPPEASAITHITNKMVADKPAFKDSNDYTRIKTLIEAPNAIFVAHNAPFDLGMMQKEDIVPPAFICTLRVARAIDTEGKFSQYRLQYLRYALDLEIEATAHDALGDVLVLEKVFDYLATQVEKEDNLNRDEAISKMIEISSHPSLMRTFNFGKYNGQKVSDVAKIDGGYLDWLLKQKLQNEVADEDWIYTLKHYLA